MSGVCVRKVFDMQTEIRQALGRKLHPGRFDGISGKMSAIVGFILGEKFTDPEIVEMAITFDGFVMGRVRGDIGMNDIIGSASDLERNWGSLLQTADLNDVERAAADALYSRRVKDWRLS